MSTGEIYTTRKMGPEELQSHLALGRRARTFADRKKRESKRACRSNKGRRRGWD